MRSLILVLALNCAAGSAFAQAPATPPAPPDPARMSRSQLQEEVTTQRPFIQNGGVQPFRPPGCTSPESRQFDFWLGTWDVSPTRASGMVVAESTISLNAQGCVIIEDWRPITGAHGLSINVYDSTDQHWHQTYADATGRRTEYQGAMDGEILRFDMMTPLPANAPPGRRRMNFQRVDENTVHQWGERFNEQTQQWQTGFDFTYRRRPGTRPTN